MLTSLIFSPKACSVSVHQNTSLEGQDHQIQPLSAADSAAAPVFDEEGFGFVKSLAALPNGSGGTEGKEKKKKQRWNK